MKRTLLCLSLSILLPALSARADDRPVVRIGATLPLTGGTAYVGQDVRRGMEMALAEENSGPVRYELVFEDNQFDKRAAATTATKLLTTDKVDIVVSLWETADVVAPIAERTSTPHLSIRWNPHIAEKYRHTFTFESTYKSYVRSQLALLKALNVRAVSLASEEGQGWLLAHNEFLRLAGEFGVSLLEAITFENSTADFQTIATRLLARKPQLIVSNIFQPGLDLFLRKIHDQRPAQVVTGYFETVDPLKLVEGIPFVAQYAVDPEFAKRFREKYGEPFKARAPHGYDLIKIVSLMYQQAGKKIDSDTLMVQLSALKDYKGATGTLSTNATKNIENVPVWSIVQSGEIVPLTPELLAKYRFKSE